MRPALTPAMQAGTRSVRELVPLIDCIAVLLCYLDIYVSCVSSTHCVSSKGFYLALVATTVETSRPEMELKPGLDLLEPIKEKWISFSFPSFFNGKLLSRAFAYWRLVVKHPLVFLITFDVCLQNRFQKTVAAYFYVMQLKLLFTFSHFTVTTLDYLQNNTQSNGNFRSQMRLDLYL